MTRSETVTLTRACRDWSDLTRVIAKLLVAAGDTHDSQVCVKFAIELQMQTTDAMFEKQEAAK